MAPPIPTKCKYNYERNVIDSYYTNQNQNLSNIEEGLPLIVTGSVSQTLDCLKQLLVPQNEKHFLLVGPHGAAKSFVFRPCIVHVLISVFFFYFSLMIKHALQDRSDSEITTIHCSANVTPAYVIYKFSQVTKLVFSDYFK